MVRDLHTYANALHSCHVPSHITLRWNEVKAIPHLNPVMPNSMVVTKYRVVRVSSQRMHGADLPSQSKYGLRLLTKCTLFVCLSVRVVFF